MLPSAFPEAVKFFVFPLRPCPRRAAAVCRAEMIDEPRLIVVDIAIGGSAVNHGKTI